MDQLPPGADLSKIPAQLPPPGKQSNFDAEPPLETVTIVVVSIVTFIQLFFLSIRIFTKISAKTGILFDDWCAIIATVLSISFGGVLIAGTDAGKHTWDVSLAALMEPKSAKITFAQLMITGPANYMGKLALFALYHRIFNHITWVRYTIYVAAAIGLIIPLMTPIDAILCSPPKGKPWGYPNPNCSKSFKYGIPQGLSSLLIDLYIMILPIPIISRLTLERKKKIGILMIFLLGSLAVVADCIVMKFRVDMHRGYDVTWAGYVILLCSVVETGISVACSSMPTIVKFSRLHVWQTGYFLSLRSLLRSVTRRTSGGSSKTPSKARSYESTPKASPKKFDPYSINMPPTTNASITQLRLDENETIQLADGSVAKLGPEIRVTEMGGKQSVEQQHEEKIRPSPRDMV